MSISSPKTFEAVPYAVKPSTDDEHPRNKLSTNTEWICSAAILRTAESEVKPGVKSRLIKPLVFYYITFNFLDSQSHFVNLVEIKKGNRSVICHRDLNELKHGASL